MILAGRFLPLGLILLAPVSVRILLFHIFLDQAGQRVEAPHERRPEIDTTPRFCWA